MQPFEIGPFRVDGHLHDLGVEAALAGLLSAPVQQLVDDHIGTCPECAALLEEARALDTIPLPTSRATALPRPANRPWRAWMAPITVAAAALLAVVGLSEPAGPALIVPHEAPDGIRVKGAALQLEVWADEGERSRQVRDGDPTSASDKLGFRLANQEAGHFMIVGVDQDGEVWLGYPQGNRGHAADTRPSDRARALDEAVRLDGRAGYERIIGLLCPDDFDYEEISANLAKAASATGATERLPRLRAACQQAEVRVHKQP